MAQDGITVNVSATLEKVQVALAVAKKESDAELKNAAESVLSALALVLRRKTATIPTAMGKYLHIIDKNVYAEPGKKESA